MMVILRHRSMRSKAPTESVERVMPEEWFLAFHSLFPDGARWNELSNGWLNEQWRAGLTPQQAFAKTHNIPL